MLDELKNITPNIGTRQRFGAGGIDPNVYVPIILFILNPLYTEFMRRAARRGNAAFREQLAQIWKDHEEYVSLNKDQNNGTVPVGFLHGNLQLNFHEELDKDELAEQLLGAASIAEELSEEMLQQPEATVSKPQINLFWDRDSKSWVEGLPKR